MRKLEKFLILLILLLCGYLICEVNGIWPAGLKERMMQDIQKISEENTEIEETKISEETETEETVVEEQQTDDEGVDFTEGTLPSFYHGKSSGRTTGVKNQGDLGTCWAVSTAAALEAYFLPQEQNLFSADHISIQNGFDKSQESGGAHTMAMAYLTAWKGPVLEEDDPYGDGYSPPGLTAEKHVQEIRILQNKELTRIKEAVWQFGAVQSSLYMDMQGGTYTSTYYNEADSAYCYTGEQEANHDVLIVGWDDEYPAENFISDPEKNGAFICQNSWGTDFGEEGFFYVSYEDAILGQKCVVYTRIEPQDNYEKIYQSDLCGWVGQLGYKSEESYFANVYEAESDEYIKAVGFYAVGADTTYEISLVPEFENIASLAGIDFSEKGELEDIGYYTINLQAPVLVEKGQKFAVVVKIQTPGEEFPVATEYPADEHTKNVDISDGEGYISLDGFRWSSTEEEYQCNLCLKVYTDSK